MKQRDIQCDLDCCFRMFRHPERPELLSEVFLGSDLDSAFEYAVCTAEKEAWEFEVKEQIRNGDFGSDYINGGGVPYDCPIYQGEVSKW